MCNRELKEFLVSSETDHIRVRLVPDLSAAALRNKQTKQLIMWYKLRYLNLRDYGGSGSSPLVRTIDGLIKTFLMSNSTVCRILALGEGKYWRRVNNNGKIIIHIFSLMKVCQYLKTNLEHNKHYRDVPDTAFTGSIGQTRAQLYASVHKPHGIRTNPISRQSITEYTGLGKQQQRRYEIEARIKRIPNFSVFYDDNTGKTTPRRMEVFYGGKFHTIQKRLGNIYHTRQEASSKGMLPKVHRLIRSESLCSAGAASNLKKRFYSFKCLLKSFKQNNGEQHYLLSNRYRVVRGRLEWTAYSICT